MEVLLNGAEDVKLTTAEEEEGVDVDGVKEDEDVVVEVVVESEAEEVLERVTRL